MPEPFSTEAQPIWAYRVVLRSRHGQHHAGVHAGQAPEHVRNFFASPRRSLQAWVPSWQRLRHSNQAFYPRESEPLSSQQRLVRTLQAEFNDTRHVKGTVSMAHGDDPASADTSFFISVGPNAMLDGKYSAFARVVDGLPVVEAIESVPVNGEAPVDRVEIRHARVERRP